MALKTKCIKAPRHPADGWRISIMSRHTLNDGTTPDPEIGTGAFDEWWPQLAPPPTLIGAYYKRGLPWKEFEERFKEHLSQKEQKECLLRLVLRAQEGTVTILCVEPSPERCHRRLVAEACKALNPELAVTLE